MKLLRVLQEQEVERVASTQTTKVNVRVIAATNRDLHEDVAQRSIQSRPLLPAQHLSDSGAAAAGAEGGCGAARRHFARGFARRVGKPIEQINAQALERLTAYDWPGNVRELANVLERAVILCQGAVILEEHVGILRPAHQEAGPFQTLEEMERHHILRALEHTGGVLAGPRGAARLLGMSRSTVWSRMRKLGIQPPPD